MKVTPTAIVGCYRVHPEPVVDVRGHFLSVFDPASTPEIGDSFKVRRVNRSFTATRGAIRGLHFQRPPHAEGKLVQCLQGAIFDVAIDLRPESPSYRAWVGSELNPLNRELLLIPAGCGHGFQTLSPDCLVEYFVTGDYAPAHEGGLRWDDPALGIAWPLQCTQTSEKDAAWPPFAP